MPAHRVQRAGSVLSAIARCRKSCTPSPRPYAVDLNRSARWPAPVPNPLTPPQGVARAPQGPCQQLVCRVPGVAEEGVGWQGGSWVRRVGRA